MKTLLLTTAALALGVHSAMAADGWFKATEPVLACTVETTTCANVEVGTVFYFEGRGGIAGLAQLWRMPDMTEVFVSPGDWRIGFKPTRAPKGW
jgi:hypothetical protein